MRYKIPYNKKWNNEGTTYSQTLNVTLTRKNLLINKIEIQ